MTNLLTWRPVSAPGRSPATTFPGEIQEQFSIDGRIETQKPSSSDFGKLCPNQPVSHAEFGRDRHGQQSFPVACGSASAAECKASRSDRPPRNQPQQAVLKDLAEIRAASVIVITACSTRLAGSSSSPETCAVRGAAVCPADHRWQFLSAWLSVFAGHQKAVNRAHRQAAPAFPPGSRMIH